MMSELEISLWSIALETVSWEGENVEDIMMKSAFATKVLFHPNL
jgi:hypothetical protein